MGTRGPSSKPKSSVKFIAGIPEPPPWLDDEAQAEYRRVAEAMEAAGGDYLQTVDLADLCVYSQAFADIARLTPIVRAEGEALTSDKGNLYPNPRASALAAACARMTKAAARLGFSPWDRARMGAKGPKASSGKHDPLEAFLGPA